MGFFDDMWLYTQHFSYVKFPVDRDSIINGASVQLDFINLYMYLLVATGSEI